MTGTPLPEPVRQDLTVRRDLPAGDVAGFLDDVWREPDGTDAGLVFADWLEDRGDARCQPVRWSLRREQAYTEPVRAAYREHMTAWWLKHGNGWVGPLPGGLQLVWHHGGLSVRIDAAHAPTPGPVATAQLVRSLHRSVWVARLELAHVQTAALLYDLSPHLRALALTGYHLYDLSGLERLPGLRRLTLQGHHGIQFRLAGLPALERVEIHGSQPTRDVLLEALPELRRVELRDCHAVEKMTVERSPKLGDLDLTELAALRQLFLRDLPALRRLDLPRLAQLDVRVRDCPALAGEDLAPLRNRRP